MLRKLISNKRMIAILVMFATLTLAFTVYASTGFKQVKVLVDNQPVIYAYTSQNTVNDLLVEFGIGLNEGDVINSEKDDSLTDNHVIDIKTSKRIVVSDANEKYEIYSTLTTVGELMDEGIITLDVEHDYMNVTAQDELFDGMELIITRVTYKTVTEEAEIPYDTEKVYTTNIEKDSELVVKTGINGKSTNTVLVTYENGIEKKREITDTEVTVKPVTEVIEVGIDPFERPKNYKKVISASATAYCACARCCGVSTGITASGMRAEYGCVAVDPRVIPLGTKLYIECADGSFIYGHSIAADTGGAIKGNKIDLFFPSHYDALQFGRRAVNVYVLD